MSLADRPRLRLFTLTILFFAQGVPWGFMAFTLPAYLAGQGLGEAALGSVYVMSYWPYVFKWVWGPAIDAFTIPRLGRRRPWILLSQTMMAVSCAGLLLVDDPARDLELLMAVILVHSTFNAMQNVAVDGLAIDLLDEAERGRANGLMYGAKYLGGVVGIAGMGALTEWSGLRAAIVVQVVLLLAIALVPLLVRERAGAAPAHPKLGPMLATLGRVFRLRSPLVCAVMMVSALLASGMLGVVSPVLFRKHLHWSEAEYTLLAGVPGMLIGFGGAAVAGLLADKLGHRKLVAIAMTTMGLGWLVFALGQAWWTERPFVYALFVIEPFTQAITVVSLWTLCMDNSVPRTAATQFAAFTSLSNLSTIIGARLIAARIHDVLDYRGIYIAAAVFQISLIALLPFIDPSQVKRELGATSGA